MTDLVCAATVVLLLPSPNLAMMIARAMVARLKLRFLRY